MREAGWRERLGAEAQSAQRRLFDAEANAARLVAELEAMLG
jgi:hypothetical protein